MVIMPVGPPLSAMLAHQPVPVGPVTSPSVGAAVVATATHPVGFPTGSAMRASSAFGHAMSLVVPIRPSAPRESSKSFGGEMPHPIVANGPVLLQTQTIALPVARSATVRVQPVQIQSGPAESGGAAPTEMAPPAADGQIPASGTGGMPPDHGHVQPIQIQFGPNASTTLFKSEWQLTLTAKPVQKIETQTTGIAAIGADSPQVQAAHGALGGVRLDQAAQAQSVALAKSDGKISAPVGLLAGRVSMAAAGNAPILASASASGAVHAAVGHGKSKSDTSPITAKEPTSAALAPFAGAFLLPLPQGLPSPLVPTGPAASSTAASTSGLPDAGLRGTAGLAVAVRELGLSGATSLEAPVAAGGKSASANAPAQTESSQVVQSLTGSGQAGRTPVAQAPSFQGSRSAIGARPVAQAAHGTPGTASPQPPISPVGVFLPVSTIGAPAAVVGVPIQLIGGAGTSPANPPSASQPAVAQLSAAMIGVGPSPVTDAGVAGGTRLTIAMAPPAIGMVSIQIDNGANGTSVIAVGATHPATLASLQNDHAALEQMLTQAGIPIDHRTITFHLEPVRSDTNAAASPAAFEQGGLGGQGQGGQQSGNQGGSHVGRGLSQAYDRRDPAAELAASAQPIAVPKPLLMRRFGVNMMA